MNAPSPITGGVVGRLDDPQFVPLRDRPIFFKVGLGWDRARQGHVTTTFMFDDAKGEEPIGWSHGEKVAGQTYRDGRGHERRLVPMSGLIDMQDGEPSCASYSVEGRP